VAAATSLAAIGLIAAVGVVSYSLRGDVKPGAALVLGIPAAIGAIGGARFQQRLHGRTLTIAFAVLLVGVGIRLLI
jgi:uncharacterized membrane protein YfcA